MILWRSNMLGMRAIWIIPVIVSILILGTLGLAYGIGTDFLFKFGSEGSGDGQFIAVKGIAVDSSGNIYVADRGNLRIQIFNSAGNFIKMFGWGVDTGANAFETCTSGCQAGISGSGDDQFSNPIDIAIDSSGNIYVVDIKNDRIQIFNSAGVFQSKFGSYGSGDGQFNDPIDIAIDSSGNIYVIDKGNDDIQIFNSAGVFQSKFGSPGSGEGQFGNPFGIALDSSGNIYVSDAYNHRIQIFNSAGNFIKMFGWGVDTGAFAFETCTSSCEAGIKGSGDGQFSYPVDIAVNSSGNIYVLDLYNHRIQIFNSAGVFQSKFGSEGSGDGQFNFPDGIALDSSGNIYVIDTNNHRIQKFGIPGTIHPAPEPAPLPSPTPRTEKVPGWIKNNAKWWAEGQIGDSDFTSGIQHLMKEKIINIPDLPEQASEVAEEKVPDWVKNNAGWWADGSISEEDFLNGIKYLVGKGIIQVS